MSEEKAIDADFSTPYKVEAYAEHLVDMTFKDVADLGICPPGVKRDYAKRGYKGGWGVFIEERYFGYKANSDPEPDLEVAGVEIKSTCLDRRADGIEVAGERLSLETINYNDDFPDLLFDSKLWHKCKLLLLIWYERVKGIEDPYQQVIRHVKLFTPPVSDIEVIEEDYRTISTMIREGNAEQLSESLTNYLGAATTGSGHDKDLVKQTRYGNGKSAKRRRWSYKQQYMKYVLDTYILGAEEAESIVKDPSELKNSTFEGRVKSLVYAHVGETDETLCDELGIPFDPDNKSQWYVLSYCMLGIHGDRAAEFEKANINLRAVRVEYGFNKLKEATSLDTFEFRDLVATPWEVSKVRRMFEETKFFYVVFEKNADERTSTLRGCFFWSMPTRDMLELERCYNATRDCVKRGVILESRGKRIYNNLPKKSDNRVAHVRPHANKAAYKLQDGTTIGDVEHDASELPDGRAMTRQSFWLNNDYVLDFIKRGLEI